MLKAFSRNCILRNSFAETVFYTVTVKNLRGECKKATEGIKGSCWTRITFSSKVINFEHFTQTSTIPKLFIKVQIWLIQNLSLKVQSSRLFAINSNPPFAYVITSIWYSSLPFWICLFTMVFSYCFTSEIQELMFLSQTLTTSWHLIQFPVGYLGRPFH